MMLWPHPSRRRLTNWAQRPDDARIQTHIEQCERCLAVVERTEPAEEIALIAMYGSEVIGLALSDEGGDEAFMAKARSRYARELDLPVVRPAKEGVAGLVPAVTDWVARQSRLN